MYRNSTYAVLETLQGILAQGHIVDPRGFETRELLAKHIRIERPLERAQVIRGRYSNIFASIAETLWVLAGRNDLGFLSRYLPRASDFSDDGQVWRGGYGPRLRNWHGVDQLKEIVRILQDDRGSRRAVMVIFDPAQDLVASKDIPCNNWLQFIVREDKLHLHVAIRSNDIIWGFSGINVFEWSVLQEMMAFWVGAEVGSLSFFTGSVHLYKRHFKRARKMLKCRGYKTLYEFGIAPPRFATPLDQFDAALEEWFAVEQCMRDQEPETLERIAKVEDEFLRTSLEMLYVYNAFLNEGGQDEILGLLARLPQVDFRVAAIEYFSRKYKTRERFTLSEPETAFFRYFWQLDEPAALINVDNVYQTLRVLHHKKSLVYKDSWKARGEVLGIFANIARKFDRIQSVLVEGAQATKDESLFDTLADLAVYSGKYLTFLAEYYEDAFSDFLAAHGLSRPLGDYQTNEGFDAVTELLLKRYQESDIRALNTVDGCFSQVKQDFGALETILSGNDWQGDALQKCRTAADLSLASARAIVLLSREDPTQIDKFESFVENL